MTIQDFAKTFIFATGMLAASAQASVVHFTLDNKPADYLNQGKPVDVVYTSSAPWVGAAYVHFLDAGMSSAPAVDYVSFNYAENLWSAYLFGVTVGTDKLGTSLTEGVTYKNTERAPFASAGHAGLDVSFDHRGCNQSAGNFTVNKLGLNGTQLDVLDVSFDQACDRGPLVHGTFYYNASLDALPSNDVPEPATLALIGLGVAGMGAARRRK